MKEKIIVLNLLVNEINVILASLTKQPYEIVKDIIPKILEQGNNQIKTEQDGSDKN